VSAPTPGPWHAEEQAENLAWQVSAPGIGCNPVVAHVYGDGTFHTAPEANARLVAAAPDLLDACEEMVRIWNGPREYAAVGFAAAVNRANAAIAQVRGSHA
jgi:hypothetical protein